MSMSVSGSVCLSVTISPETHAIFTKFFVHVAYVFGSVLLHVYDRPHCLSPGRGFSSLLKMHYRQGKGDGSAQCGRSMLSTIALFILNSALFLYKQKRAGTLV